MWWRREKKIIKKAETIPTQRVPYCSWDGARAESPDVRIRQFAQPGGETREKIHHFFSLSAQRRGAAAYYYCERLSLSLSLPRLRVCARALGGRTVIDSDGFLVTRAAWSLGDIKRRHVSCQKWALQSCPISAAERWMRLRVRVRLGSLLIKLTITPLLPAALLRTALFLCECRTAGKEKPRILESERPPSITEAPPRCTFCLPRRVICFYFNWTEAGWLVFCAQTPFSKRLVFCKTIQEFHSDFFQ